jgi:hypothetical protein
LPPLPKPKKPLQAKVHGGCLGNPISLYSMQSVPQTPHLRRFAGWMMLCAYLAGIQGLAPLAFGGVASLEHGHEVSLSQENGDWHLVLSHPDHEHCGDEEVPHPEDDHGSELAAEDDHHHGPAHVFCFASDTPTALGAAGLSAPKVTLDAELIEKCACPEFRIYPVPVYLDCVAARPPPGKPAWLVCLRTTVLIV